MMGGGGGAIGEGEGGDGEGETGEEEIGEDELGGELGGVMGGGASAVCWLLEMPGVPPKFDGKAADALQVPRGPLRGVLCAGKPATLADGRVIQPEQARP